MRARIQEQNGRLAVVGGTATDLVLYQMAMGDPSQPGTATSFEAESGLVIVYHKIKR
jgi:hypothetical protein